MLGEYSTTKLTPSVIVVGERKVDGGNFAPLEISYILFLHVCVGLLLSRDGKSDLF